MQARGKVPIKLDRERMIFFDYNAIASFEKEVGIGLLELMTMAEEKTNGPMGGSAIIQVFGARYLRELLWAGLLHEDERLTPKRVGALIQRYAPGETFIEKLSFIAQPLFAAFNAMLTKEEDGKNLSSGAEPNVRSALTGTSSRE